MKILKLHLLNTYIIVLLYTNILPNNSLDIILLNAMNAITYSQNTSCYHPDNVTPTFTISIEPTEYSKFILCIFITTLSLLE